MQCLIMVNGREATKGVVKVTIWILDMLFNANKFILIYISSNIEMLKHTYLNILSKSVKDLFCHLDSFGEIPLPLFINNIFPRVIPIEITN